MRSAMSIKAEVFEWLDSFDYLGELSEYIKLPSRSSYRDEVKVAGEFAIELMTKAGLTPRRYQTEGNDVIFGDSIADHAKKSILIYGHMDVQPEGDLDKWNTPPFEPTRVGDKLFGRGTADNKGQHFAHMLALRFLKEKYPDVFSNLTIKFILDGDEELGSFSLPPFVQANKELLDADFIFVSDGPSLVTNAPTIVGGVRGIVSFEIKIQHNAGDLHSGNFGGVARSAALDLMNLLNTMVDEDGKCKIQGFYNDITELSEFEKQALNNLEPVYNEIIAKNKITNALRPENLTHQFLNECWPTFNINGLGAGSVKVNRRTIIPSEAYASIDCRLVANMQPERVIGLIKAHVRKWSMDKGIEEAVSITFEGTMAPSESALNSEWMKPIQKAAEEGFETAPVIVPRLGGSLPIQLFPQYLKKPTFLVPFALPDENNHSPNENLDIPYMKNGIAMSVILLKNLSGI